MGLDRLAVLVLEDVGARAVEDARGARVDGGRVPAGVHAVAGAIEVARELAAEKGPDATVLINLSGRGDKDMGTAIDYFGLGDAEEQK